ncbi:MAG: hypothetical protein R3234_12235, partial [Thermoanaerobaculia bacterium]|nr:hypothetical protein [Thermoanaerobaculia bacterium]
LFFGGRTEEARSQIEVAARIAPTSPRVRLAAGTMAAMSGRERMAQRHFLRALERYPSHPVLERQLRKLDRPQPRREQSIDPERLLAKSRVRPGHLAVLYAGSGEVAKALTWLERAVAAHDPTILFFRFDPRWDELRGHPRYRRAMRTAGLAS